MEDTGEPISIHQFSSNALIQEQYLRQNSLSREHWLILTWLQDSLDSPEEPKELRGDKWLYTRSSILTAQRSGNPIPGVSELDIDAPIRQGKPISPEDKKYEDALYKYIFELIRSRQFKEAHKICEQTKNYTLALAFRGLDEYYDSQIDGHVLGGSAEESTGIQNQMLWRRMCFNLARDKNLSDYERGIYGVLSSDIGSVVALSDTWEQQLLAYLANLVAAETEDVMRQAGRVDPEVDAIRIPGVAFKSVKDILQYLEQSAGRGVQEQSQHVVRLLLSAVIKNDIPAFVDALATSIDNLANGRASALGPENTVKILRVAAHLVIVLKELGLDVGRPESYFAIIVAYIEMLQLDNKTELIPLYVSYLEPEEAVTHYSLLLATITDATERKTQLQLAQKYDLDVANTVRQAVKRVFDEHPEEYIPNGDAIVFTPEVSENDKNLIDAVGWYKEAAMWPDAVRSSVALYRLFLGVGKVQSALRFGNAVSWSLLATRYSAYAIGAEADDDETVLISAWEQTEFAEYGRLVECVQQIQAWDRHYENRARDTRAITSAWKSEGIRLVSEVSDSIHALSASWLQGAVPPNGAAATAALVQRLRVWYVPQLLTQLLRILTQAQLANERFLYQAVRLATIVADERLKLYDLFVQSGTLKGFLGGIAEACTDGVAHGEEGIFDL
ncbi:hypothetical protein D0Z00_004424 [Geotrichum galactomycetum]|uniref:Uncharacterized protein n=1 Tax=Geotrichum galactomycetum TaxID=27317 RepID=A0ACB6UYG3_9ASCO|nr:hypothetical protein D0Z00_004424 [Geotrichum candidum]